MATSTTTTQPRTEGRYETDSIQGHDKLTGKVNVGTTERLLSVIAGGALIAYGLTQEEKGTGATLALGGGGLPRGTRRERAMHRLSRPRHLHGRYVT